MATSIAQMALYWKCSLVVCNSSVWGTESNFSC